MSPIPSTVPDGFEYEAVADGNQGRTLHGGQFGGEPILAEQVQAKVSAIDADVSALDTSTGNRLDTLETPPIARMILSSDQSIPHGTGTVVDWTDETYDSHDGHSNGTNPSRYVFPVAGLYRVTVNIAWQGGGVGGDRWCWLQLNGGLTVVGSRGFEANVTASGDTKTTKTSVQMDVSAGSYVEVNVQQNSGGALDVNSGNSQVDSSLEIEWIRPPIS